MDQSVNNMVSTERKILRCRIGVAYHVRPPHRILRARNIHKCPSYQWCGNRRNTTASDLSTRKVSAPRRPLEQLGRTPTAHSDGECAVNDSRVPGGCTWDDLHTLSAFVSSRHLDALHWPRIKRCSRSPCSTLSHCWCRQFDPTERSSLDGAASCRWPRRPCQRQRRA